MKVSACIGFLTLLSVCHISSVAFIPLLLMYVSLFLVVHWREKRSSLWLVCYKAV